MDDLDIGATIRGFSPGQKAFRRYTLQKILGRGGMGVVWLARDDELERDVALKFLPEVVAMDKQAILELKRETRRSLELTHPHIIRIYDFVQDGRTAAISMEFVTGDTLAALKVDQAHHCFAAADLGRWVRQLCEALDYAHGKAQIVHRDLKPANLMVDARGDLKIADFGIAASVSDSVSRVSNQGTSGTPVYMSPQQMMGEKPAVTDDIYSLGATLYDLLTGKPPFHSGNILMQVQNKVPAPLGERTAEFGPDRAVPPEWEATIAACLAKDPAERPKTAREVAQRLGLLGAAAPEPVAPAKPVAVSAPPAAPAPATPKAAPSVAPAPAAPPAPKRPLPKEVLWGALAAVVLVAAGLGWYFGLHVPAQAKAAAEAARVSEERELTRAVDAVRGLLARADWASAEAALNVMERTARTKPAGWAGQWESALAELKAALRDGRETARLAALRVPVTLRTTPSGAEIFFAGQSRGVAPVVGLPLPLGEHKVVARLAGHDDLEFALQVTEKGQAEWTLPLVRSSGSLAVASVPADASFEVYAVNPNGEAAKEPLKQGLLPVAALTLPTGEYEVLVASRREGSDVFVRQRVAVRRGETAAIQADVRGATLEVTSTPSGATVALDGETLGVTPLKRDGLTYGLLGQVTVTAPGFKPAARAIQFKGADEPQAWDVTLEKLPDFTLRPKFIEGPRRVLLRTSVTTSTRGRMVVNGETQDVPPNESTITMASLYEMSGDDGQGGWSQVVSDTRELTPTNPFQPGTLVALDRTPGGWQPRFVRGGFTTAGMSPDILAPSYPALWFDADALPAIPLEQGKSWDVPPSSWGRLLQSWRLVAPTGSMRATVRAVGGEGDDTWAEVEYRFDVAGMQQTNAATAMVGSTRIEGRGTLTARVEVGRKYVSRAVFDSSMRITSGAASADVTHTVAAGETPFNIARQHGVSVEQLVVANKLSFPIQLRVGQQLVIPGKNESGGTGARTAVTSGLVGLAVSRAAEAATPTFTFDTTSRAEFIATPETGASALPAAGAPPAPVASVPVRFYRKNNLLVGIGVDLGVEKDGRNIVYLPDGTYQEIQLPPGRHAVRTSEYAPIGKGRQESDAVIEVAPGQTNHFELVLSLSSPPKLEPRTPEQAAAAMRGLKPSKGSR